MDTVPPSNPSRLTTALRILCSLLFCLAAGYLIAVIGAAFWALGYDFTAPKTHVLFAILAGALFFGIAGVVFCVLRKTAPRFTIPGLCCCAAALSFFAVDERPHPGPPPIGPIAGEDSIEQQAYLQMAKGASGSICHRIPQPDNPRDILISKTPTEWAQYIANNEERIINDWGSDEFGQAWIETLAELPPEARLARAPSITAPLIDFRSVRAAASHRLAYAVLLAKKGESQEAAMHLRTLISAAASLQRIGHSAVDEMTAVVILNKAYVAVEQLVDATALDNTTTEALRQAVDSVLPPSSISERCILADAHAIIAFAERPDHWLACLLFIEHPNRTRNTTTRFHLSLLRAASVRDWAKVDALCVEQHRKAQGLGALRNAFGNRSIDVMSAALGGTYSGMLKKLEEHEDARLALLARLQPTPAAP